MKHRWFIIAREDSYVVYVGRGLAGRLRNAEAAGYVLRLRIRDVYTYILWAPTTTFRLSARGR